MFHPSGGQVGEQSEFGNRWILQNYDLIRRQIQPKIFIAELPVQSEIMNRT